MNRSILNRQFYCVLLTYTTPFVRVQMIKFTMIQQATYTSASHNKNPLFIY